MSPEEDPAFEVRAHGPGEPACLAAFAPRAGEREPVLVPRDEAEWDWLFRRNPAGTRLALAWHGSTPLGGAAAVPVRTRFIGEVRVFAQLLDAGLESTSDPARVAAWRAAARALHETWLAPEHDLVHYGWPRAFERALGRAELEHERLRVQSFLVAPSAARAHPTAVEARARFGPEVDVLYACCATHWHASAVRDAGFLNWRFAEHPRRRYRLLVFQNGDVLRGYAVVRASEELGPRLALVVDWLVLPGDEEAAAGLLDALHAFATGAGALGVCTAIPEWSPWSLWLQERGFRHHPSEHVATLRAAVPRYDMLWLRDNWWTTLADALEA
jgi:hypothetical protein